MPRIYTPSNELFRARIRDLVEGQGYARQQRQYGVTRRTIRRWMVGESRPSARTRRSVVRRGLRESGEPVLQGRDESGRFNVSREIYDDASIRAVRAERTRRRQARLRAIQEARTPRQRQRAEAMPRGVTMDEAVDIQRILLQRFDNVTAEDWYAWQEALAEAGYTDLRGRRYFLRADGGRGADRVSS